LLTNKENCALKLVDKIILYYDARSKKLEILGIELYFFLWYNSTSRKHMY